MTKVDPRKVGMRVKKIRTNILGKSMTEFGTMVDGSAQSGTVSNWETGKNLPNNQRIKKIAELGNMSVDELLYGEENYADDTIEIKKLSLGHYMIRINEVDKNAVAKVEFGFETLMRMGALIIKILENDYFESVAEVEED